jgi:tryptophanyl-tRNA synthetase
MSTEAIAIEPRIALLTGLRPTGSLTLANVVGAVQPILRRQAASDKPILLFVADLHALTDNAPQSVAQQVRATVRDLLALGIDTTRVHVFVQSALSHEVNELAGLLAREVRVSELLRQPSLKEKLRSGQQPENATAALLMYPVLMAADILIHRAAQVPVGQDQLAHLELARLIARRFNTDHGATLVEPQPLLADALRILALRGGAKMSKSDPETALLLSDDDAQIERKVAGCQTAPEGEASSHLDSHVKLIEALDCGAGARAKALVAAHLGGARVMAEFKRVFAESVIEFVRGVRARRAALDDAGIDRVLRAGTAFARASAARTLDEVHTALGFRTFAAASSGDGR